MTRTSIGLVLSLSLLACGGCFFIAARKANEIEEEFQAQIEQEIQEEQQQEAARARERLGQSKSVRLAE